jgi:hypothetical protein
MDKYSLIRSTLSPGQLVSVSLEDEIFKDIEFNTTGIRKKFHVFFGYIRLDTWPGWNDYFGTEVRINEGDTATILRRMGRPRSISEDPKWAIYDVYEILIHGKICQAFRCHLIPNCQSSLGGVK